MQIRLKFLLEIGLVCALSPESVVRCAADMSGFFCCTGPGTHETPATASRDPVGSTLSEASNEFTHVNASLESTQLGTNDGSGPGRLDEPAAPGSDHDGEQDQEPRNASPNSAHLVNTHLPQRSSQEILSQHGYPLDSGSDEEVTLRPEPKGLIPSGSREEPGSGEGQETVCEISLETHTGPNCFQPACQSRLWESSSPPSAPSSPNLVPKLFQSTSSPYTAGRLCGALDIEQEDVFQGKSSSQTARTDPSGEQSARPPSLVISTSTNIRPLKRCVSLPTLGRDSWSLPGLGVSKGQDMQSHERHSTIPAHSSSRSVSGQKYQLPALGPRTASNPQFTSPVDSQPAVEYGPTPMPEDGASISSNSWVPSTAHNVRPSPRTSTSHRQGWFRRRFMAFRRPCT